MSDTQVIRGWEECVVSKGKGNRIIHYVMRDTTGYSVLAVVGIEKSARHVTYTVAEEFAGEFGSTDEVLAGKKWKTRREVVHWLASFVSKRGPILADSKNKQPTIAEVLKNLEATMARFSPRELDDEVEELSESEEEKSDIVWSGDSWMCNKQLRHYPSFYRNKTNIPVYSFVWVLGEGDKDLLGYVEDMYENRKAKKMVRLRWFNFTEELGISIPEFQPHCREVFITPHEQEISAECIDGLAAILTPNHFDKCFSLLPESISCGSVMCHREVKDTTLTPFSMSKLRGYATQPILHALEFVLVKKGRVAEEPAAHGSKRCKSSSENQMAGKNCDDKTSSEMKNHAGKCGNTRERLKAKFSSKRAVEDNHVVAEPKGSSTAQHANNIEFLCQDSGMRGCWFPCKILQEKENQLKIQYYNVKDAETGQKLEEWIPASREANPDNLGVRCTGRLTVRPWPLNDSSSNLTFEVGTAVDANWSDGWWEGVVIGCDPSSTSTLHIYLPGENKFLTVGRNDIRIARDWIDEKWVDVKRKPDILSVINLIRNPALKLPPLPPLHDFLKMDEGPKDDDSQVHKLHFKKRLLIRSMKEQAAMSSGNAGADGTSSNIGVLNSSGKAKAAQVCKSTGNK